MISMEPRCNLLALKQPDDANVEANLGAALAELGRFPEAKSHFERALQIDPQSGAGERKTLTR
jgi:Flp pilus assembly protein TadD